MKKAQASLTITPAALLAVESIKVPAAAGLCLLHLFEWHHRHILEACVDLGLRNYGLGRQNNLIEYHSVMNIRPEDVIAINLLRKPYQQCTTRL